MTGFFEVLLFLLKFSQILVVILSDKSSSKIDDQWMCVQEMHITYSLPPANQTGPFLSSIIEMYSCLEKAK